METKLESKTAKFKKLFSERKYKAALKIIKSFKQGLEADEIRTLNIAWECITGKANFYQQIGISTEKMMEEAYRIMFRYAHPDIKIIYNPIPKFI